MVTFLIISSRMTFKYLFYSTMPYELLLLLLLLLLQIIKLGQQMTCFGVTIVTCAVVSLMVVSVFFR